MNRYAVNSLIGQGSFGCVYKAVRREDEKVVAIKVIPKRGRSNRELKNLRRECEIQAHLKHPNVIKMIESFESKFDLFVVTEFALMDLHRYLSLNGAMPEEHAQRVIVHLVSALYYLHSNRILHRDLKPQNVLLDKKMHAKLCDFGLARNMTMGTHVLTSIKGTPLYMAPELLAEQPYDHHADMWSLGCIAYESVAGQPPFCTTSILHLVKLIKHEEVKWPSTLTSECRSFLQGLLEKDPAMRISWSQLLCHPFVEGKLYIAQNSPFINQRPNHAKTSKAQCGNDSVPKTLPDMLDALQLNDAPPSTLHHAQDNLSSSRDSINAIPPSDIENIETDLEDNISRVIVPFATDTSYKHTPKQQQQHFDYMERQPQHVINSQTCFVSGNSNMILNHLNDNFPAVDNTKHPEDSISETKNNTVTCLKRMRSKDLEKRKLSQNLDNFSLRLGHIIDGEAQRKTTEMLTQKSGDKELKPLKTSTQSTDDKQSTDNTPPCLLPGWDSCDESQSPPIENDEWLAFLNRSIQEIFDGEFDSLKQHNLVSIIVAPLRNSKAIPKVLNSVAQLLSLPFVLAEPIIVVDIIKSVYIDVKLVPNLMYACKLMLSQRQLSDSLASTTASAPLPTRTVRTVSEMNAEEISTACSLYELVCHLVHLKQQFLTQFCDAVAILAVNDLFINFLAHDLKNADTVRIANCVLAMLCCVLRELPENAELVEKIVLNTKLQLVILFEHNNDLLRLRTCMLLRLLARFSLRRLQCVWSGELKQAIEHLAVSDPNGGVREEASHTLEELTKFSFFVSRDDQVPLN